MTLKPLLAAVLAIGITGSARAANWTVDQTKSSIGFTGTQTGQPFSGSFSDYTAVIDFDPANPAAGHALITIHTASAKTGDTQRDEALPGADWFNTAAFPDAIFKATSFKPLSGNQYDAIGTLTIRDKTVPVMLPFTFRPSGNNATVTGHVVLLRTDYGVGQGSWATGDWVGLNVTVTIKLVAAKA
jgi:polyisoprenoid-binding protein YceI